MADKKITVMAQFYEQCQTKGYIDMTDATQSLKAKVIASDLNLNYGNIVEFYAKAKTCYDQVQVENAEAERKAGIERKAAEEEAARRAVDGELLVSISNSEKAESKEVVVKVYVRPDHSIYSVVDGGEKIEGAPAINISDGVAIYTAYHPSQAVYTGATVGGITTGGVHHTKATYSEKAVNRGNGNIEISIKDTKFRAERIVVSPLTENKFKRDQQFNHYVKNGVIICVQHPAIVDQCIEAARDFSLAYEQRMNLLAMAADKRRLPYNTCAEIGNLLGRMANAHFPPSDAELYSAAEALFAKTTSAEVKRAAEAFAHISDYRDAAKREKEAEAKYEELLQKEKEQAILKKEAAAKSKKKFISIFAAALAVVAIVAVLVVKVVIPNGKYSDAIELMEAQKYKEAIEAFEAMDGYKDSAEQIVACETAILDEKYESALVLMGKGEYENAITAFDLLDGYKDSADQIAACEIAILDLKYDAAVNLMDAEEYKNAITAFGLLDGYKDSADKIMICAAHAAEKEEANEQWASAAELYEICKDEDGMLRAKYKYIKSNYNNKDTKTFEFLEELVSYNYQDAQKLYNELYEQKFTIVVNNDDKEPSTNVTSVNVKPGAKTAWIHVLYSGGTPYQENAEMLPIIEYYSDGAWKVWSKGDYLLSHYKKDVWQRGLLSTQGYKSFRFVLEDPSTGEVVVSVPIRFP